jgi:hypothetical protein
MIPDKEKYKSLLALMESDNNYFISSPALGKYQFTTGNLNSLKNLYSLPDWKNAATFVNSPQLQEIYFNALYIDSLNFIKQNNLEKYTGLVKTGSKRFKTITAPINIYGLLAAIHLSGGNNVKNYFVTGYDPNDGFTSLSDYLVYFSEKLQSALNPLMLLLAFIPAIVLYYS